MRLFVVLMTLSFSVGCSKVDFGKPSASGSSDATSTAESTNPATTSNGSGNVANAGGVPGVIVGAGNAPADELPKVKFVGPPCQALSECAITFVLDKAYPGQTEFDWKTNDTLYGTAADPGLPPWGKPGQTSDPSAQYVPTSGHIVFTPGTTSLTVYVQNINRQATSISIGVLMSNCVYDRLLESCQGFFSE